MTASIYRDFRAAYNLILPLAVPEMIPMSFTVKGGLLSVLVALWFVKVAAEPPCESRYGLCEKGQHV